MTVPLDLANDILIRAEGADPAELAMFKQAGFTPVSDADIEALHLPDHGGGLWPGITRPPGVEGRGDETASASRDPWVDANGYKVAWLRALHKDRPAVLHYRPDKLGDRAVPYDSLELALVEAWAAGGNYILAIEPHYREALRRKDAKAIAAWRQLERTAAWLRSNRALFRQPVVPIVTTLVDEGEESAEIVNLFFRRNVSPSVCSVASIPPPNPNATQVIVAVNLTKPPADAAARRLIAHAEGGAALVTTSAPGGLKQIRGDEERAFYAIGKGQVVGYKTAIADPSEFALDVIDIVTHKQRAVRLWNAPTVIALATASPKRGERLMHLVNYGSPINVEVQARVQGIYNGATLLRPDADPVPLTTAKRGTTTEVQVPEIRRLAVVAFT